MISHFPNIMAKITVGKWHGTHWMTAKQLPASEVASMKSLRGEMKGKIIRMGIHSKSYDHEYQGNKREIRSIIVISK